MKKLIFLSCIFILSGCSGESSKWLDFVQKHNCSIKQELQIVDYINAHWHPVFNTLYVYQCDNGVFYKEKE